MTAAPTNDEWLALTANTLRERKTERDLEELDPHAALRRQSLIPHPQGFGYISKTCVCNQYTLISWDIMHAHI
jgi:hypothetical protein